MPLLFEGRFVNTALLKKIIDSCKDLVENVNFECTEKGMSMQSMDSAHVAMITFLLKSDAFEYYNCTKNMTYGINIATLSKLLKCSKPDDVTTMRNGPPKTDNLTLLFEDSSADRVSTYEMKLLDIESEHYEIDVQEYEAVVTMSSKEFKGICDNLQVLGGDSVSIDIRKNSLSFKTEGQLGNSDVCFQSSDEIRIETVKDVCLQFSIKYLTTFSKAYPLSDQVVLSLGEKCPALLSYNFEGGCGNMQFYLAPKFDTDEMEI